MKIFKHKLYFILMLLMFSMSMYAQVDQTICFNSSTSYSVDSSDGPNGTPGSTYTWSVAEAVFAGTISGAPTNAISIDWGNTPVGIYTLQVVETAGGCDGVPQEITIEIINAPNAGDLAVTSSSICMGDTTQSVSSDGDAGGTWSSSDDTILTVAADGTITPVGVGTATITYTVAGAGSCADNAQNIDVIIVEAPNAGVLAVTSSTICMGDATQIVSSDGDAGGTWSSSDDTILTVAADGTITPVGVGTASITYTVAGAGSCADSTQSIDVNIVEAPNAGVLSVTSSTICMGDTTQSVSSDGDAGGAWSSSDDTILTVAADGTITPVGVGTASITYTVAGAGSCADSTQSIDVNIVEAPNAGVLSVTSSTICMGDTTQSVSSDGDAGGAWSSSDDTILTVAADGTITPVGVGTASITYTVAGAGSCADSTQSIDVNIVEAPNAGVLSVTSSTICMGDTTQSVSSDGDAGGAWSSSDDAILTVAADGTITPIGVGTAIITYTITGSGSCGSDSVNIPVTINPIPTTTAIDFDQN